MEELAAPKTKGKKQIQKVMYCEPDSTTSWNRPKCGKTSSYQGLGWE